MRAEAKRLVAALTLAAVVAGCNSPGSGVIGPPNGPTPTSPAAGAVVPVDPDINAVAPAKITVVKAQRWKQGKYDAKPDAGNVYVAVLVKITAVEDADYSPYYAKVRDGDGFEYDFLIVPAKKPSLSAGELAPGKSVQGWVTFEVPKGSTGNLTLIYDSIFGEQVDLPLKVSG